MTDESSITSPSGEWDVPEPVTVTLSLTAREIDVSDGPVDVETLVNDHARRLERTLAGITAWRVSDTDYLSVDIAIKHIAPRDADTQRVEEALQRTVHDLYMEVRE